jgi:hypothetical protein
MFKGQGGRMFVRIARFEGGEDNFDERVQEIRRRIRGEGGENPMTAVRGSVKRFLLLADRENRRGAGMLFCESEDDLRRVNEAMNQMTPPPGAGARSSVEMYEVVLDEQPS